VSYPMIIKKKTTINLVMRRSRVLIENKDLVDLIPHLFLTYLKIFLEILQGILLGGQAEDHQAIEVMI